MRADYALVGDSRDTSSWETLFIFPEIIFLNLKIKLWNDPYTLHGHYDLLGEPRGPCQWMVLLGDVLSGTRSGSVIVVHALIDRAVIVFLIAHVAMMGIQQAQEYSLWRRLAGHNQFRSAGQIDWSWNQGHFGHFTGQMICHIYSCYDVVVVFFGVANEFSCEGVWCVKEPL